MTQPIEMLRQARDLVASGWCQGVYSRNEDGHKANAFGEEACDFCATGSLMAAMYRNEATWNDLYECFGILSGAIVDSGFNMSQPASNIHQSDLDSVRIQRFNDTMGRTQEEVVAVFEQAIAKEAP